MPEMPMVAYKSSLECYVLMSCYVGGRQGQIIFKMKKQIKEKQANKHNLWIMTVRRTYCWQVGMNLNQLNNVFVRKCEIS